MDCLAPSMISDDRRPTWQVPAKTRVASRNASRPMVAAGAEADEGLLEPSCRVPAFSTARLAVQLIKLVLFNEGSPEAMPKLRLRQACLRLGAGDFALFSEGEAPAGASCEAINRGIPPVPVWGYLEPMCPVRVAAVCTLVRVKAQHNAFSFRFPRSPGLSLPLPGLCSAARGSFFLVFSPRDGLLLRRSDRAGPPTALRVPRCLS
ncbi:hypothetical protein NDU88_002051 [Pleurodeles waltl]|uniref:Uncharacterized protein n=1 Tax=Pleurodeles waltl TaxID=8319 RepID=A0AAV7NLZ3_PLEWA|nr:hypothetical protein NDU88_002051 [Pleurodeles waltl]